jgi:hypothetical protein
VVGDLKEHAGEDTKGPGRFFLSRRHLLVMAQISLSLTLLVSAGLFLRGALKAGLAEPGFDLDNGVIMELDPGMAGYNEARSREIYQTVLERLGAMSAVESVSVAATVPFGMVSLGRPVYRDGDDRKAADSAEAKPPSARMNMIGADYFKALGLPIIRGRAFNQGEAVTGSAPPVAIIDDVLAKRLWRWASCRECARTSSSRACSLTCICPSGRNTSRT